MTIELNGASVYYEQHGQGHPTLVLHGWGGKCESFAPLLRDCADALHMTALDFPGHARSGDPPEPWSVTEYMEMTAQLLRALDIPRAHIVAHSFGGRVALVLAATYPELVGRMVLTGVPGLKTMPSPSQKARSATYRALKALLTNRLTRAMLGDARIDALRSRLQERFGSADYKALSPEMRKTFSRVINQDLTPYLNRIAAPTLLFWGDQDTAAPLWMGRVMELSIRDAGLVVMQGAGHYAYLDRYADFRAVVRNFLCESAGGER